MEQFVRDLAFELFEARGAARWQEISKEVQPNLWDSLLLTTFSLGVKERPLTHPEATPGKS
eukprot:1025927-Amphidinium_carterae.1